MRQDNTSVLSKEIKDGKKYPVREHGPTHKEMKEQLISGLHWLKTNEPERLQQFYDSLGWTEKETLQKIHNAFSLVEEK